MSKKVFNVFSILCFALVLCFIGCTELINPKTETDINLNIDLSKIIKSTRNTGETQSSASLGENPTIKVAIYDAKKYDSTTNSTYNLDLITEAQAKIVNNEAKVKLNNIPVGIYAIVFAELSFSNENSTEVMYAGNSKVFKVKASDNEISLELIKVGVDDEVKPDDSNTPYVISSWDDLENKIKNLSDDTTPTEFIIMDNLTATYTITVSKPVKITSDKNVTISRGNSSDVGNFEDSFFRVESAGNLELAGTEEKTITLYGGNQSSTNDGGAVYVSGGTFTMNDGVTITNCNAKDGGAVYITNKGTFNMNGGTIYMCFASNSGGGVWMNSGSSFTMSGGKIDNCNSSSEGGGVYVTGKDNPCTFKMLDSANITGCSAVNGGGGVSYGCGPNGTFEISGTAKISDNVAYGNGGGGIYLYGKLTMDGGTISNNEVSNGNGAGVYVRNVNGVLSSLSMSGNAIVEADDDVYLESETTVTVAGELSYLIVATITPENYEEGTQVLTADNTDLLAQSVGNFALSDESGKFEIDEYGKIALVSQNYAEGLTCVVDSDNNTVTLYIRNADGLATFRNIVNGSLDSDIIVQYENNSNSPYTFYANNENQNVNAVLESDIKLSGDWTPIGVYSNTTTSAKPYSGTFDGNGNTITFVDITHESTEMYSSGLFQMLAGTVKNLIIDGSISRTATGYIGGITGYLNGGTIENCVNNATITNSASNGTGGIVGYVDSASGTIQNCINLVSVTGGNSVGGIVGGAGPNSLPTIKKCINIGDIKAYDGIASGIYGYATASSSSSSSSCSILDCINLGSINGNFACGIVYNSDGFTSVSNCINIGGLTGGTSVCAIANLSSGNCSNNYYDSTKIPLDDKPGITGKATSYLIGLYISLDGITTDNWTFAEGRYPLPDIAGSIPGGEDGEIWSDVLKAATTEVTSGGGNEPLVGTEVPSFDALQNAINGDAEVIIITSDITITNPLVINKKIKICTSDSKYQLARATVGAVKGPMFEVTYTGELTLQNIIITGGYDSGYDDAVNNPFIYNKGKTVIENSTLKNNFFYYTSAYKNNESESIHFFGGGAIFSNGNLTINNSSMENFYINSSGGGTIYIESGTCNIDELTISGCTATENGGGIYAAAGTININKSEINNNSAKIGKSVYFKTGVIYSINGNGPVTVTTPGGCNEDITPSTSNISFN